LKLFVCVFDDVRLLPHFLRHYDRFGVTEYHIAAPRQLASYVASVSRDRRALQYNDFNVAGSFTGGVEAVTNMRQLAHGPEEWVTIVDLDEFVEFPEPVTVLARKAEAEGANIVRGIMYDRFAMDGKLKTFSEDSDLPALFPVRARFRRTVMRGNEIKGVVVKGRLVSRHAHHEFHDERPYSQTLDISHYKWNDRAVDRTRLARDMCAAANSPWDFDGEFKRVLDHYDQHGRFAWETFGGQIVGPAPETSAPAASKGNWMRRFSARSSGTRNRKATLARIFAFGVGCGLDALGQLRSVVSGRSRPDRGDT
jgi:hypothetical protein